MRNRSSLNNLFSHDRKVLYMILCIVMIAIFTLTIVYAALSTTLNINGNAEVSAASWDIYLDNVQLNSESATTGVPIITDSRTASFTTTLSKPGDFYEFTIDVVNNGTIDAMIDSITKTPTLTTTQAKYLNYIVEYQNGEAITTKQLVSKNSFVRLKVKLEFRRDITASDLPTQSETLNLAFTVNYVQSDSTAMNVKDDGVYNPFVVGNQFCFGEECFYVISSDDTTVTMFAAKNIGLTSDYSSISQNCFMNSTPAFSTSSYWTENNVLKSEYGTSFPAYVYDSNSSIFSNLINYTETLENLGVVLEEIRLIKLEELFELGCNINGCSGAPSWTYDSMYWTGTAKGYLSIFRMGTNGSFASDEYTMTFRGGIRPVIKIAKDKLI